MPAGELGRSDDMLTALPRGTQESGAGGIWVDARAGGSDGRKLHPALDLLHHDPVRASV